jgi:sugar transferase (PEP-CTERM/EpsH1 system associated)
MRILMLAHRMPYPPRTGDKVRAYHIARHLAAEHDVTLACVVDEPGPAPALAELHRQVGRVEAVAVPRRRQRLRALLRLARGESATVAYFHSEELDARIAALLAQPLDLLLVSSSSMAQYIRARTETPVVMDFVDVDSDKWLQYGRQLGVHTAWLYRLEGARLRACELAAARRADACVVATRAEAELLASFAPWAPTTVIPNGVDLEYFAPARRPADSSTIVFTGAMDYVPNVDAVRYFADAVLPRIRARRPDTRFVIVGKEPARSVRRLAARPGVLVTGAVPDVRPFVTSAAVAVAPLRIARGVQNKVLEAMAMGLPVVATRKAHEGIDARPGEHLFVEDDPVRFADLVLSLLADPERRAEVGRTARRFVETRHSWPASMRQLDDVIRRVTRHTVWGAPTWPPTPPQRSDAARHTRTAPRVHAR